jgi:orotidine-5'-phosphate decarboxylase
VVGATYSGDISRLRERMPRAWLLLPGVGAQGATVDDVRPAFDARGRGALVAQSRGVMQCFAPGDPDWRERIAAAARSFAAEVRAVAGTA